MVRIAWMVKQHKHKQVVSQQTIRSSCWLVCTVNTEEANT